MTTTRTPSGVRWPACARLPRRPDAPARPRPRAVARFTRAASQDLLHESHAIAADPAVLEAGDELTFRRTCVRDEVLRKLQRGQIPVEAEIDLHGMRLHAAHDALRQFLNDCVRAACTACASSTARDCVRGPAVPC